MKKLIASGAAFALALSTAAFAWTGPDHDDMSDEDHAKMKALVEQCEAGKTEDSKTDCHCLAKKAVADEQVLADLMAYTDMETVGEAGKGAIMACQHSE